jgi:hypothetical protein
MFVPAGGSNPLPPSGTPNVDRIKAALYVVLGLVLVVGLLEVGTQFAEYFMRQAATPVEKVLHKTYKPLTVLAVSAFLLICYARFQWLDKYTGDYTQSFIFDLLMIMFVMGLLYVVAMLCILAYATYVVDQWSEVEKKYKSDGNPLSSFFLSRSLFPRLCAALFWHNCRFIIIVRYFNVLHT